MAAWLERVLDALFPEECRVCGEPDVGAPWVCDACIYASPFPPPIACATCGLDVGTETGRHRGPLVLAATRYDADERAAAAMALRMLKYDDRRRLARPLATLLHRRAATALDGILVPVPLHPTRRRRRGYNQAALLARHVGRLAKLPVNHTVLRRTRNTPTQTDLDRTGRLENLAGAFMASGRLSDIRRRVILVDDVATTGATLTACAAALRTAGVDDVVAVVVARRILLSRPRRTR